MQFFAVLGVDFFKYCCIIITADRITRHIGFCLLSSYGREVCAFFFFFDEDYRINVDRVLDELCEFIDTNYDYRSSETNDHLRLLAYRARILHILAESE